MGGLTPTRTSLAVKWGRCVKKSSYLRTVAVFILLSLLSPDFGCSSRSSNGTVTITFVDPEWAHDPSGLGNLSPDARLEEFTRLTGIGVRHLTVPEGALDQLKAVQQQLRTPPTPEVYSIDVFWPGILNDDLIDLTPYLSRELSLMNPNVVASYTVNGRLVAVPYTADMGALYYRKDLLKKYGYAKPPQTLDELEKMAVRIQQGERSQAHEEFWGFVWPGAAGEGLSCNALEWQAAEGGGRIIEDDGTISVNNPHSIRAWQRAAQWVGWISPPSVTSYQEWDAINMFFAGKAAFFRGWALSYFSGFGGKPIDQERFGITHIPGGKGGQAATLGGFGLGVTRSAVHIPEAIRLVQLLIHNEMQFAEIRGHAGSADFAFPDIRKNRLSGDVVTRPAAVSGPKYAEVDHAYLNAVHSVLIGKATAPDAAAALETELVRITGFKTGPPSLDHYRLSANAVP
jgi:trehalose/maltose transport system substrate-binding protein